MAPSVREFYTGKSILVTGATGFVGKVLVEKLLRDCPGIKAIYLLLRQKKGVPGEERLKELCNNRVFELIQKKDPSAFSKLKFISGDILEEDLGLSNDDKQELQRNCHIIIHSAACVRFDQRLKDAVHMNTTGTHRLLKLAETMESLEAFVHLSTAYCRCDLEELDEKLYPAVHNPRKIMDIVDWMDDATLKHIEPKIIESEPNTYSYTKAITEDLVAEYSSKFPIAIGRPSIVTSAWKEPMPGWVDNLNGPTGLLIGSGKGVIRTMHCEPSYTADAIPVDVVANGCILIAYATALDKSKEPQIFNMTLSGVQKITWKEVIETGEKWVNTYPFLIALWYPGGTIKSYWLTHQLAVLFFHWLPAYLCDALLFLLGKKTFMVNVQKRISHGLDVLQYYTTKEWHFKNNRFLSLMQRMSEEERDIFYIDVSKLDRYEYLRDYVLGARHFVCKEDPSTLPRARKLHKIAGLMMELEGCHGNSMIIKYNPIEFGLGVLTGTRYVVDVIFKLLMAGLFVWVLYSKQDFFTSLVTQVDSTLRSLLNVNSS